MLSGKARAFCALESACHPPGQAQWWLRFCHVALFIAAMLVSKVGIPPYLLVKSCCSEPSSSLTPTAVPATTASLVGPSAPSHDLAAKGLIRGAAWGPLGPSQPPAGLGLFQLVTALPYFCSICLSSC